MTTITQKRTTKTMAEMGIKGLLNLCFKPHPLLQKSSENFHYQLFLMPIGLN